MTPKKTKPKPKRKPAAKTKSKATRSTKPLLAESGFVRSGKRKAPRSPKALRRPAPPAAAPSTPAPTMGGAASGLMSDYLELPARLARCRTPVDVWLVQVRFAQRVCGFVQRD